MLTHSVRKVLRRGCKPNASCRFAPCRAGLAARRNRTRAARIFAPVGSETPRRTRGQPRLQAGDGVRQAGTRREGAFWMGGRAGSEAFVWIPRGSRAGSERVKPALKVANHERMPGD